MFIICACAISSVVSSRCACVLAEFRQWPYPITLEPDYQIICIIYCNCFRCVRVASAFAATRTHERTCTRESQPQQRESAWHRTGPQVYCSMAIKYASLFPFYCLNSFIHTRKRLTVSRHFYRSICLTVHCVAKRK